MTLRKEVFAHQVNATDEASSEIPKFPSVQKLLQNQSSEQSQTVESNDATVTLHDVLQLNKILKTAEPNGAAVQSLEKELDALTKRNTDANANVKPILKADSKDKAAKKPQCSHAIEREECKDYVQEKNVVYNSCTGEKFTITKDHTIVEESKEDTLYFFQMIQLNGNLILLFYDDGAATTTILGAIAELLRLEILNK